MQEFLDDLDKPLIRNDYAEVLRSEWRVKLCDAQDILEEMIQHDFEVPEKIENIARWIHLIYSNAGYRAQADAWKRWINLRIEAEEGQNVYLSREAFVDKFRNATEALEAKIGQAIPAQVEICHFMIALQERSMGQDRFEDITARATESGGPIDMAEIYDEFIAPIFPDRTTL